MAAPSQACTTCFTVLILLILPFSTGSYLSWPRIHFSGSFVADTSTINNVRCNYLNKKFTSTNLMKDFPFLKRNNVTGAYSVIATSFNPEGTQHFYFMNSRVKSFCEKPSVECSTTDPIVGLKVTETQHGVMVDLEGGDWQVASRIYGLKMRIAGIMDGLVRPAEMQHERPRGLTSANVIKSIITNITWQNSIYGQKFNNANELSISLTLDQYDRKTLAGRVTATIGPLFIDEPLTVAGFRAMYQMPGGWMNLGNAPVQLDTANKLLTVDLSLSLDCDREGMFYKSSLGKLDLALLDNDQKHPRFSEMFLTENGGVSLRIVNDNRWYKIFGGVMTFNLSHLTEANWSKIMHNRLALVRTTNARKKEIVLSELPNGIHMGIFGHTTTRLNVPESFAFTVFVLSFGIPLKNEQVLFSSVKMETQVDCGWNECKKYLGVPEDALRIAPAQEQSKISHSSFGEVCDKTQTNFDCEKVFEANGVVLTDASGMASYILSAVKNPGNPRGCQLDGQIYPLEIKLRYKGDDFVVGTRDSNITQEAFVVNTQRPAVWIFSNDVSPNAVNPTWQDVKDTFQQYHNLFPVMWRNDIANLGTFDNVLEAKQKILFAMSLPEDDPRSMPISRDLSRNKMNLINTWLNQNDPEEGNEIINCTTAYEQKDRLRELVMRAVSLELTTIPPYFTAWLSLKTEFGRNLEIGEVLESIYVEEMFHMAMASNILTAIGGKVELKTFANIPSYPTPLAFGSFFELASKIMVSVGKMSIGVTNDIFSQIEHPEDELQQQVFHNISCICECLASAFPNSLGYGCEGMNRSNERVSECFLARRTVEQRGETIWTLMKELSNEGLKTIAKTKIDTIGALYGYLALKLSFLEACAQTGDIPEAGRTIFHPRRDASQVSLGSKVKNVTNLKDALGAIIRIVYEGEGGSECSPYESDENKELNHYYRFQEIVHGRRLKKLHLKVPPTDDVCLTLPKHCQAKDPDVQYCYSGDSLILSQSGIWPLLSNPTVADYPADSVASRLNTRFNTIYTRLLRCLHDAFGGKPELIGTCITKMHDLRIVGKSLVSTPIAEGVNACPTWSYVLSESEADGLPVLRNLDY